MTTRTTPDEHERRKAAERTALAERYGLSEAQVEFTQRTGGDLERIAAMKDIRNVHDFEAAQESLRLDAEARKAAARLDAIDRARKDAS